MRALYSLEVRITKNDKWDYHCSVPSLRDAESRARTYREALGCYGTRIKRWVRPNKRGISGWMVEKP